MSETDNRHPPCVTLYATCIHEAAQGGDRSRMQAVEAQAAQYLSEVESALAELRAALGRNS